MDTPGSPAPHLPDHADVEAAARALAPVFAPTPLQRHPRLSTATGLDVWLKREDLQPVRSYKARGAFTVVAGLDDAQRAVGVTCASAGNHAQGVALACARAGVRARIFLPRTTPRQKRERVAALGGHLVEVVITGDTYDEAAEAATSYAESSGAVVVPAFDDPAVVAGQGTVTLEVLAQLEAEAGRVPDLLVLPVGGGGLIAGAVAALGDREDVRLAGVEPAGAASMIAAVAAGAPVTLAEIDGFVDGAAVRRVGTVTHAVISAAAALPHLTTVAEGRVCVEMLELYQADGIVAEPAGALATAALPTVAADLGLAPGSTVVCVVSGGNNDVSRYAEVVERALVHEGRKHYFLVDFPQEPGALRRFLDEVLGPDDDITLFEYVKRNNRETGPALVGVELSDPDDLAGLHARMDDSALRVEQVPPDSPLFRFLL